MNKLIFSLILLSLNLHAAPQEIVDPVDAKSFVGQIYDLEIEDMLSKTTEFNKCRNDHKFDPSITDPQVKAKRIQAAEDCIKKEMSKDTKRLTELSNALNLQQYGLTKSKSVQDLQKYLNDKMYKAMTGVSLEEENKKKLAEDLKFGKKKIIDQAVFIQMYKTQLGKNALHEISRFCFEHFRHKDGDKNAKTFAEYWKSHFSDQLKVEDVNDQGDPAFGSISDPSDKDQVYKDIFKSIQTSQAEIPKSMLENFFLVCGKMISPLCEQFQKTITSTVSAVDGQQSPGAAACLAKARIQDYRKAIANVDKVAEEFEKMKEADGALKVAITGLKGEPIDIKVFGDGKDPNEESVDDLTNFTSKDIIEGGYTKDQLAEKKAKECEDRPEIKNCEGFIFEGDKFNKAKHQVELELTIKREVEMERVRKIVNDKETDIKTYLEENGHIDILNQLEKNPNMSAEDIAKAVGLSYEGKKRAMLEQMNQKLGKRQVSQDSDGKPTPVTQLQVKDVINESKEERARLAQVVLFNNIITSHIALKKKDGSSAGRNVGAWKKEEKDLDIAKVDQTLFANLKTTDDDKGIGKDAQIAGFGILDEILGKKPEPNKGSGN